MSKKEREICEFIVEFKKYFLLLFYSTKWRTISERPGLKTDMDSKRPRPETCFSKVPKMDQFIDKRQCYTNYFEQFVNSLIIHYLRERIKLSSSFHKSVSRPLIPLIFYASTFKQANRRKKRKHLPFTHKITYVSLLCFFLKYSSIFDLSLRSLPSLKKNSSSVETLWSQLRLCLCLIKANNLVMMTSIGSESETFISAAIEPRWMNVSVC